MDPADPSAWHDDPREDTKPEPRESPRTWRRGPPLAPRPAHNLLTEPTLTNLLDWHSHNIDRDPLFAHYSSAAAAVLAGVVFGLARGASTALLSAKGSRLTGFILATKTATPLYVTPFVLGTQLDCWPRSQRWRRSVAATCPRSGGGTSRTTPMYSKTTYLIHKRRGPRRRRRMPPNHQRD